MKLPPEQSTQPQDTDPAIRTETSFVYVKIPVSADHPIQGHEREHKIDQALTDSNIGTVLGWGSSLGEMQADGTISVAFHRIDIEVTELLAARLLLQALLPTLGVPAGTEIHYKQGRTNLQDLYSFSGWAVEQPLPSEQSS